MGYRKKHLCVSVFGLFLVLGLFCSTALAQQAVPVITLADGSTITMTQAQFDILVTQSGVSYYGATGARPQGTATQMVVPVPSVLGDILGGGFIVGEPAAIAAGMNAVGITSTAIGADLTSSRAAAGTISIGTAVTNTGPAARSVRKP